MIPSSATVPTGGVPAPVLAVEPEALALGVWNAPGADGPVEQTVSPFANREPDSFLAAIRAGNSIPFVIGQRSLSAPMGCEHCGTVTAALNPKHGTDCPCACHVAAQLRKDTTS